MKLKEFVRDIIVQRKYPSVRAAAADIKYPDGRSMSHTTLSSILKGNENIDTDTLRAIARWAGVPTRHLYDMLDNDHIPMPYTHVIEALMAIDESFREALLALADAARDGNVTPEDTQDIASFIKFKISQKA